MSQSNNMYYSTNYITSADLDNNGHFYNEHNFIHFESCGETHLFKNTYNDLQYGHECCDGKGILVYNKTSCELNKLKKELFSDNIKKKTFTKGIKDECVICYENKQLIKTVCEHSFCNGCISEWIQTNNTCPMCRSFIN